MGKETDEKLQHERRKTYGEMIEKHPEFEGVIMQKSWEHIGASDEGTVNHFKPIWLRQMSQNKKIWQRSGRAANYNGIGVGKAVIGIGAGPSLKKNLKDLLYVYERERYKPWKDRNFIFVASNHMLKPLLAEGMEPDFAILMDAGTVCNMHLNEDYPKDRGQKVVLLAGLHTHPTVLRRWRRQGRRLALFTTLSDGFEDQFKRVTGENPEPHLVLPGGNVLNTAWSVAMRFFAASVFMCVGNDLSYPAHKELEDRRDGYYADGDYRANIGNLRDEAKNRKHWGGFNIVDIEVDGKPSYTIQLTPVATTGTLWVYKTWIEANILANYAEAQRPFQYYNCTEGGILGVMSDSDPSETKFEDMRWFLLDQKCPRWRTRRLMDACAEFIYAKEQLWKKEKEEIKQGVQHVEGLVLPPPEVIVRGVRRPNADGTKQIFHTGAPVPSRDMQPEQQSEKNSD